MCVRSVRCQSGAQMNVAALLFGAPQSRTFVEMNLCLLCLVAVGLEKPDQKQHFCPVG